MKYDVIVVGSGSAGHVSPRLGRLPHRTRKRSYGRDGSTMTGILWTRKPTR